MAKGKSIKILKVGKEIVTVMDTEDYENKLTAMFNTKEYRKINGDPTKITEAKFPRNLKLLVEVLEVTIRNHAPKHTKSLHIYGLPKLYNEGYPLKAIVLGNGSPCHSFVRFLLNGITAVAGKSSTHIDYLIDSRGTFLTGSCTKNG
jgi:hypothetical protein